MYIQQINNNVYKQKKTQETQSFPESSTLIK